MPPFLDAWPTASDPNDRPIWTAAVRAGASFVVSHNLRDFPPRDAAGYCAHQGIEFITAENFVGEVLGLAIDEVAPYPAPAQGRIRHRRRLP